MTETLNRQTAAPWAVAVTRRADKLASRIEKLHETAAESERIAERAEADDALPRGVVTLVGGMAARDAKREGDAKVLHGALCAMRDRESPEKLRPDWQREELARARRWYSSGRIGRKEYGRLCGLAIAARSPEEFVKLRDGDAEPTDKTPPAAQ